MTESRLSRRRRNEATTSTTVAKKAAPIALGMSLYTALIMSAKTGARPARGGRVPSDMRSVLSPSAHRTR